MKVDEIWRVWTVGAKLLFIIEIPMLILIEQVLKQYWYVSRCANNELAPCILKLKNNTEWKQTTVTEITENRFGNFRFWGENMLDRFGFFSFSSPGTHLAQTFLRSKCFFRIVCTLPSDMPVQLAISLTDNCTACLTTIFTAARLVLVTEVLGLPGQVSSSTENFPALKALTQLKLCTLK